MHLDVVSKTRCSLQRHNILFRMLVLLSVSSDNFRSSRLHCSASWYVDMHSLSKIRLNEKWPRRFKVCNDLWSKRKPNYYLPTKRKRRSIKFWKLNGRVQTWNVNSAMSSTRTRSRCVQTAFDLFSVSVFSHHCFLRPSVSAHNLLGPVEWA